MSAPQSAVEPSDKLRFRYIAAYFVDGLQCPTTGPVLIFSDAAQGKKLLLTDYSHENLRHIDTKVSIANLILNASFQAKTLDLGEVKNQSPKEQEDRIRRHGQSAAYLLVEASHEQEASAIGQIGESDKREFCLALPNGFVQATRERHKLFIDQAQAFLCFSMPNVSGFEEVGQCVVASHPSGKPLYVLSFGMGTPRLSVLSAVPTDGPKQFADLFQHSSKLAPFQSAFRLAAGSASNARDELRAFFFAFTALEVFINKVFSDHKQRLLAYRKGDLPSGLESHVAEIEQRMREQGRAEDEYPLAYRFSLVAGFLSLTDVARVVEEFDLANGHRNTIVHGRPFDEAKLPTAKAREWLGELVRLYVGRKDLL